MLTTFATLVIFVPMFCSNIYRNLRLKTRSLRSLVHNLYLNNRFDYVITSLKPLNLRFKTHSLRSFVRFNLCSFIKLI